MKAYAALIAFSLMLGAPATAQEPAQKTTQDKKDEAEQPRDGVLDKAGKIAGTLIFHAGTGTNEAGETVATGGRVLNVTANGSTIAEAQERAYKAVDRIDWPGGFCRRDIGWREVAREAAMKD